MTAPNFIGINCTISGVNDNTLTTTSGSPGENPFTGGAYSSTGYTGVSVSTPNSGSGSGTMWIGLNTSAGVVLENGFGTTLPITATYALYFHSDIGVFVAIVNGASVAVQSGATNGDGSVGQITYNGTTVNFTINGLLLYSYVLPVTQYYQTLYVNWAAYYSGAVSTLTVTPIPFVLNISPNAKNYSNLITSEHNQKPNFMNVVGVIVGAGADIVTATQTIQPSFNLLTAVGSQLDILGLWIGQSRDIANVLVVGFFGFSEASTGLPDGLQEPFGELSNPSIGGVWYQLGESDSGTTVLNDIAYLTILKARIVKNQWNGTISGIESALAYITGVACSIADTGNLSLSITVPLPITPLEEALLESLDLIPRPAGVRISSIIFA
jgi:hypothetical protein